jgi:FtsH-binding integral membrane protein
MADSDSGLLKSNVFQRTTANGALVSDATYNMVLGLVLCWGFLVNWLIVRYVSTQSIMAVPYWVFLIGYFASCFAGVYLFNSSDEPAISFLGYNLVVVPFGLIVNMVVSRYNPSLVLDAIRVTALVTIAMMTAGALFPAFFVQIQYTLFLALLGTILIELVQLLVFHVARTWTDWVVTIIFCGYVGLDWGRANRIPKTIDNAIDSAAAIYMDIINLFLRILSIMGRRRD